MAYSARMPSRAHQIGHSPLKKEVPCSHYLASNNNNLSDIAPNSLILGVCGVDLLSSNPDVEGHYVSDFYAFNAMLRGVGAKQNWITPVSPGQLVEAYGDLSHGSPYRPHKVVLSMDTLDKKLITPPSTVPKGQMVKTFFRLLKEYRDESEDTGAPIVVFLFAPVAPHIEDDEFYRIEYSAETGTYSNWLSAQLKFSAFETATAIKGLGNAAVMIRPDCCSKMPEFTNLFDGTISHPETFVRQLARAHRDTCAGDWTMAQEGKFRAILSRFLEKQEPTPEELQETYDYIEFRTSSMDLADTMVHHLGLPRPLGRPCIWWHRQLVDFEENFGGSQSPDCVKKIYLQLQDGGIERVIPLRRTHGRAVHWPFTRPTYYVAAAMELAGWDSEQVAEALAKMKEWKKLYEVAVVGEEDQDAEDWVQLDRPKHWWKNIGKDGSKKLTTEPHGQSTMSLAVELRGWLSGMIGAFQR